MLVCMTAHSSSGYAGVGQFLLIIQLHLGELFPIPWTNMLMLGIPQVSIHWLVQTFNSAFSTRFHVIASRDVCVAFELYRLSSSKPGINVLFGNE